MVCETTFPPCFGPQISIIGRLTQNFQCRRARWQQLSLSPSQQRLVCTLDLAELVRGSYPTSIIKKEWLSSRGHDPGYTNGIKLLALLPQHRTGTLHSRTSFPRKLARLQLGLTALYGIRLLVAGSNQHTAKGISTSTYHSISRACIGGPSTSSSQPGSSCSSSSYGRRNFNYDRSITNNRPSSTKGVV